MHVAFIGHFLHFPFSTPVSQNGIGAVILLAEMKKAKKITKIVKNLFVFLATIVRFLYLVVVKISLTFFSAALSVGFSRNEIICFN